MMVGYEIEIRGMDEQLKRLGRFSQIADRRLGTAMRQSVSTIVAEVRPLTPVGVSARLRNSIGSEVRQEGPLSIVGRVGSSLSDEVYPAVMEFGRRPGSMPPPGALVRWVHLRLRVPEEEAGRVAFLVARKIGKRGIPGKFFMKRGWQKSRPRVERYFDQALQLIANDLALNNG